MLLGLAWHNTVVEDRQVAIKTAVIPCMNSSWAGTQRGTSTGWTGREGQKEKTDKGSGAKRGGGGDHSARTMGLQAALQSRCVNSFRLNGERNPHKGRCTNIVGNPSSL